MERVVNSKLEPLDEANERILSWTLFGPKLLFRLPRNRSMTYRFRFVVKNPTAENLRVKVQLESPSPILVFQKTKPKQMSKSRLYAKITTQGLSHEQKILAGQEKTYDFSAVYAP